MITSDQCINLYKGDIIIFKLAHAFLLSLNDRSVFEQVCGGEVTGQVRIINILTAAEISVVVSKTLNPQSSGGDV